MFTVLHLLLFCWMDWHWFSISCWCNIITITGVVEHSGCQTTAGNVRQTFSLTYIFCKVIKFLGIITLLSFWILIFDHCTIWFRMNSYNFGYSFTFPVALSSGLYFLFAQIPAKPVTSACVCC